MSQSTYLAVTLNDGTLLKSENQRGLPAGFATPLPKRPPITSPKQLFELESFSVGLSNAITIGQKTGASAGKPDFSDLSVMRFIDVATTHLFQYLTAGKSVKYADVLITRTAGDTESLFSCFGLGTMFTTSMQWSGASGGDQPSEAVSLGYAQFWIGHRSFDTKGQPGQWAIQGWDRTTNRPL